MTYDPFQTYSAIGAYPGSISPFQSPYAALQTPLTNPIAGNPMTGVYPQQFQQQLQQQLQLAQILAARAAAAQLLQNSPFTTGLQNPLGVTGFENPLLPQILGQLQLAQHAYGLSPHMGQLGQPFAPQAGQIGFPHLQGGQGLAPQSWIGQPGVHPLFAQQVAARAMQGAWAGF